nr:MAG TPA: hypothetical protein [Caudoviricetes sp.]DAR58087.1 MAG TPA: hypothetical protein [Caudoviricetes sp.]DAX98098.1 MAG TPA: hypothetical protein [Caudoviricetes sp.]
MPAPHYYFFLYSSLSLISLTIYPLSSVFSSVNLLIFLLD